jgi:hypothetical protein
VIRNQRRESCGGVKITHFFWGLFWVSLGEALAFLNGVTRLKKSKVGSRTSTLVAIEKALDQGGD